MKIKRISLFLLTALIGLLFIPCTAAAATLTALDGTIGSNNQNYTALFDGNTQTSWGLDWQNGSTTAYVVFKATPALKAAGYVLTTGEDNRSYKNRNPRDWKLYGCNDYDEANKTGGTWAVLHTVKNDTTMANVNSQPYSFSFDNEMSYGYYKLEITANRGDTYLKISELSLLTAKNKTIDFQAVDGKPGNNAAKENYTNLFDGRNSSDDYTKYCVDTENAYVVAKASDSAIVTGYTFITGNDSATQKGRNPKSWVLYGSNDYDENTKQGSWAEIHAVANDATMTNSNYTPFAFSFENETAYTYYKFEFTEDQGAGLLQLCGINFSYRIPGAVSFRAVEGTEAGNSNENYTNLFDGRKTPGDFTKYCVELGDSGVYVVAKGSAPTLVTGYTFTTGNDTQQNRGRNPKSWVLYGSNTYGEEGVDVTWTKLHAVTNDTTLQNVNFTPFVFQFENETYYNSYKFEFTEDQGTGLIQLCEIEFDYTTEKHDWQEVSKTMPTCTESGYIKQTCTICNAQNTIELAPLGHAWQESSREEPTCTEVGHSHKVCTRCDATKDVEIAIIDHIWNEVSREEPTCANAGTIHQRCTMCGKPQDIEIPTLEHTWAEASKIEPTCFDSGKLIERCTLCNEERETVLAPLGHIKGENNLCANCGKHIIRIGDTYYFNLPDAVNAATYNQTIEILENIVINGAITVGNTLTIELNGFTVKQTGNSRLFTVTGTLTLKDSSENHTGTLCGGKATGIGIDSTGGGIEIGEYAVLNMIGATISDCTASASGGGIYVNNNAKLNMSGGAVIKNCTVSKLHGGGIINYGTAVIKDSKIINCSSNSGGGGIYTDGLKMGGNLDLYNTVIEGCSVAMNGGGGITAKGTGVNINENTVIRKNTAPGNYGAGILATDKAIVTINNSQITENTANEGAGILANLNSSIVLSSSEVSGNNADAAGGGIMLSASSLEIANGSIINNTSSGNGGGIYANDNSNITFNAGDINGNRAQWGGGVYLHNGSGITVSEGSYIQNNTAARNGGGIILNDKSSTLTMTGGSISYNQATGEKSDGNGGGICGQKNAVINISGGAVDGNTAVNGGGIYLMNNSAFTINGGYLSTNAAEKGGGVYIDGMSRMTFSGGSIAQNIAASLGGGIYVGGSLTVGDAPQIRGNRLVSEDATGAEEADNNIYLPAGKTLSLAQDGLKILNTPTGEITPVLYVTAENGTAVLTDRSAEDYSAFFRADNADYAVLYEDEVLRLVTGCKVSFIYEESYDVRIETVVTGKPVAEPESEPWKEGYTFVGWLKDGKDYDFSTPVTGDITLTPKWAQSDKTSLNVTFNKVYVVGLNQNATLYLAAYDKDGRLIDARTEKISDSYFPTSFTASLADLGLDTAKAVKITAFLLDDSLKPLCDKASHSLS